MNAARALDPRFSLPQSSCMHHGGSVRKSLAMHLPVIVRHSTYSSEQTQAIKRSRWDLLSPHLLLKAALSVSLSLSLAAPLQLRTAERTEGTAQERERERERDHLRVRAANNGTMTTPASMSDSDRRRQT